MGVRPEAGTAFRTVRAACAKAWRSEERGVRGRCIRPRACEEVPGHGEWGGIQEGLEHQRGRVALLFL